MPSRCPDAEHGDSPGRWEPAGCSNWHASMRVEVMGERGRAGGRRIRTGDCWLSRAEGAGEERRGRRSYGRSTARVSSRGFSRRRQKRPSETGAWASPKKSSRPLPQKNLLVTREENIPPPSFCFPALPSRDLAASCLARSISLARFLARFFERVSVGQLCPFGHVARP
jgi:hypothetical protein